MGLCEEPASFRQVRQLVRFISFRCFECSVQILPNLGLLEYSSDSVLNFNIIMI